MLSILSLSSLQDIPGYSREAKDPSQTTSVQLTWQSSKFPEFSMNFKQYTIYSLTHTSFWSLFVLTWIHSNPFPAPKDSGTP